MKWAVRLKYYNPASPYPICGITCYDISLETYPQLKSMLKNELVIVSGTVVRAGDETQLKDVKLEFPGVRIKSRF